MIIEFFQSIEGVLPDETKKFRPLYGALSHPGKLCDRTIKKLKNEFDNDYFDLTPNDAFDYDSPKDHSALKIQAGYLRGNTLEYFKGKFS